VDRSHRGDDGLGDEGHDVVRVHEGRLRVELGELELPVGPQVLIPEATGHLVVTVGARHHEQLLEELGALRQGVEAPWLEPGGHDEVARSLGR
jgi:hypothetical protein